LLRRKTSCLRAENALPNGRRMTFVDDRAHALMVSRIEEIFQAAFRGRRQRPRSTNHRKLL
jgi:hypothetical protein